MVGASIPFQKYDKNLALRLQEILASSNENCYVGLPDFYHSARNYGTVAKNFWRLRSQDFRRILAQYANKERLYISTGVTQGFPSRVLKSSVQEKLSYFEKIKMLFAGRKLVIISGSTVFDKIRYNIFEKAASRIHVFANSQNAWFQYNEILEHAKTYSKDCTICAILGPTATVLAWDLAQEGYTAWDIGHLAKWYDAFIKEGGITNPENFYAPD